MQAIASEIRLNRPKPAPMQILPFYLSVQLWRTEGVWQAVDNVRKIDHWPSVYSQR
jgi:hypothetical protein